MKKYGGYYEYEVYFTHREFADSKHNWEGWVYAIYCQKTKQLIKKSDEWFDTKARAEFAAIGDIQLLENGEG